MRNLAFAYLQLGLPVLLGYPFCRYLGTISAHLQSVIRSDCYPQYGGKYNSLETSMPVIFLLLFYFYFSFLN